MRRGAIPKGMVKEGTRLVEPVPYKRTTKPDKKANKTQDKIKDIGAANLKTQLVQVKSEKLQDLPIIKFPGMAADILGGLSNRDREVVQVLYLNNANKVIGIETAHKGTVNVAVVSPHEIYKTALLLNATGIIFAHNHPSGNPKPSAADKEITEKLIKAGELFDITLIDSMIIGFGKHYSMHEEGDLDHLKTKMIESGKIKERGKKYSKTEADEMRNEAVADIKLEITEKKERIEELLKELKKEEDEIKQVEKEELVLEPEPGEEDIFGGLVPEMEEDFEQHRYDTELDIRVLKEEIGDLEREKNKLMGGSSESIIIDKKGGEKKMEEKMEEKVKKEYIKQRDALFEEYYQRRTELDNKYIVWSGASDDDFWSRRGTLDNDYIEWRDALEKEFKQRMNMLEKEYNERGMAIRGYIPVGAENEEEEEEKKKRTEISKPKNHIVKIRKIKAPAVKKAPVQKKLPVLEIPKLKIKKIKVHKVKKHTPVKKRQRMLKKVKIENRLDKTAKVVKQIAREAKASRSYAYRVLKDSKQAKKVRSEKILHYRL